MRDDVTRHLESTSDEKERELSLERNDGNVETDETTEERTGQCEQRRSGRSGAVEIAHVEAVQTNPRKVSFN